MNHNNIYPLLEILNTIESINERLALYYSKPFPWVSDTPFALFDPNEEDIADDGTELGFPVAEHPNKRWHYALQVADVQNIMRIPKAQKKILSDDEKVAAFNYYYDRDAFIQLE